MNDLEMRYYIYPVLATKALGDRIYSSGYRQWAVFPDSSGREDWLSVDEFQSVVGAHLGTHTRNTYKTLSRHSGVYWDYVRGTGRYCRGRVRIFSPHEVAEVFGFKGPGPRLERPVSEAAGRAHKRNLYRALAEHYARPVVPMIPNRLEIPWGIKVKTRQSYHICLDLFSAPES